MKAHQRIIREQKAEEKTNFLFDDKPEQINIKTAIIKEVDKKTAEKIILEYEWLGTMGITKHYYGIYFNGFLGGVVCYGNLVIQNGKETYCGEKYKDYGIQISRGACVWWAHEHSASKLISESLKRIKNLGYKWVVAYSDPEAGEIGTVYQATNWVYLGFGKSTHWNLYRTDGKLFIDDGDYYKKYKGIPYKKYAEANGLEIRYTKPKGIYVYLLGNKTENKEMLEFMKEKIKPYPKRQKSL